MSRGRMARRDASQGVLSASDGPVSLNGRRAVGASGNRLPRRRAGSEPLATAGEVVPGDPALQPELSGCGCGGRLRPRRRGFNNPPIFPPDFRPISRGFRTLGRPRAGLRKHMSDGPGARVTVLTSASTPAHGVGPRRSVHGSFVLRVQLGTPHRASRRHAPSTPLFLAGSPERGTLFAELAPSARGGVFREPREAGR